MNSSALEDVNVVSIAEVLFEDTQSLKSWADLTVGNCGISVCYSPVGNSWHIDSYI